MCSHTPSALNAGAKRSDVPYGHASMLLLGEGSEATEPYNKYDKIRPHSIRSLQFDQKVLPLSFRPEKFDSFTATTWYETQENKKCAVSSTTLKEGQLSGLLFLRLNNTLLTSKSFIRRRNVLTEIILGSGLSRSRQNHSRFSSDIPFLDSRSRKI